MKKSLYLAAASFLAAGLTACDPVDNGYEGTNYIVLSTTQSTVLYETVAEPLTVNVMLTTTLDKDLTLTFTLEGTPEDVVSIDNNPLVIKAGELEGTVAIRSNNAGMLKETANYKLTLSSTVALPEKVALKNSLSFTVNPDFVFTPTDGQEKIITAYKARTGIDLTTYIGLVDVNVVYDGYDYVTGEEDGETITGKTIITLSDESTEEVPVLKMLANPMGMQDKMYRILKGRTVEYEDIWLYENEDGSASSYQTLMNAINWNATTEESFSMTLDGIKLNGSDIEYTGAGVSNYGDEITVVPFNFYFSAYERELKAIEDGSLVKDEDWILDATADPVFNLNCAEINLTEEEAEENEEELFVKTTGSIAADKMTFIFCFAGDNDYLRRVIATYSPIK